MNASCQSASAAAAVSREQTTLCNHVHKVHFVSQKIQSLTPPRLKGHLKGFDQKHNSGCNSRYVQQEVELYSTATVCKPCSHRTTAR